MLRNSTQLCLFHLALVMAVNGTAASSPPEPSNLSETRSVIGKDSLAAELAYYWMNDRGQGALGYINFL